MGEAIAWWITLQLLGLIAFPTASVVLRGLPDRGWAVSKVLGLLLVGWLAYTLAMMQLAQFGRGLLFLCALALAGLSAWILLRKGKEGWTDLRSYLARPGVMRYIVVAELLFTVAFVAWAWFRAYNPDIYTLEKFMDFGFMNSITISGTFPPNDHWLAGHHINYYYFGYVLMASLTLLAGVSTEIGYNLANVSLFSLTALGAFGVTYNFVAASIGKRKPLATAVATVMEARPSRMTTRAARATNGQAREATTSKALPVRRTTGRQSVAGESITSNAPQVAVLDRATRTEAADSSHSGNGSDTENVSEKPMRQLATPAYEPGGDGPKDGGRIGLSPLLAALVAALMVAAMGNLAVPFAKHSGDPMVGNGWVPCFLCLDRQQFNYFAPSRIIQDYKTVEVPGQEPVKQKIGNETINEFPVFSFVIADLHPHVMALPLVLLAASCALAFARRRVLRGSKWLDGLPRGWQAWLTIGVVGIVLGSLYTANTWDYPAYMLIVLMGIAVPLLANQRESETRSGWRWVQPWIVQSGLLVALSFISFTLFHLTFKSLVGGQAVPVPENLRNIPLLGGLLERLSGLILVNTADKTITGFIVIFGVFLVALIGWLVYEVALYINRRRAVGEAGGADWSLPAVLVGALALAFLWRFPLLGLLFPMAYTSFYLMWREPKDKGRALALGMAGLGALIGLVIEVVYLKDVFNDRMNTLFKFYYQMWVVWGVVGAYGVWRVLKGVFGKLFDRERTVGGRASTLNEGHRPAQIIAATLAGVWGLAFGFLFVASLTYIVAGPLNKLGPEPMIQSLDGIEHLSRSAPGDYQAIKWLRANASGDDVVLECCRDEYNNPGHAGRVSSYTGIPTLISWDGHESQWRGGQPELLALLGARRQIVNAIYQGQAPAHTPQGLLQTLRENNVTYVFVGAVERGEGSAAGSFAEERVTPQAEALFQQALTEVFRSDTTVIYRVPPATAGQTGGLTP